MKCPPYWNGIKRCFPLYRAKNRNTSMEHLFDWLLLGFTWTLPKCDSKKKKKMWPSLIIICHLILMWSWHDCKCMNVHIIYVYPYLLNWLSIGFLSDKGSRLQDHMALYIIRELWDTGYQTTICKHWHLWLIIIFGQFLERWYQGFYQYQPFMILLKFDKSIPYLP